jgi:hypothetical protein
MKKYMTIVHAKNQIFILKSAELLFWKTVVQMSSSLVAPPYRGEEVWVRQ